MLDIKLIKSSLNKSYLIELFPTISSTNHYLKQNPNAISPQICLAEEQTQGRGRFDRTWHSPFGKNIYLSCLYTFTKPLTALGGLSQIVGLSIIETLKNYALPQDAFLKWPNDVLVGNKKIAGCLIEIKEATANQTTLVIGIGLNVNMLDSDTMIQRKWTSLQALLGRKLDRNHLCAELINQLFRYLEKFQRATFAEFIAEYAPVDYLMNKEISLQCAEINYEGKYAGMDSEGQLLLRTSEKVLTFSSGEATIKSLLGTTP